MNESKEEKMKKMYEEKVSCVSKIHREKFK